MEELDDYGLGTDKWVRCWAHILNILVTTLFAYFDNTGRNKNTDPKQPDDEDEPSIDERHEALNERVVVADEDASTTTARGARQKKKEVAKKAEAARKQRVASEARYLDMEEEAVEEIYEEVRERAKEGLGLEEEVDRFDPKEESASDRYTRSSVRWTIDKAQRLAERCRYNRAIRNALNDLSAAATPPPPRPHSIYPAVKTRWNSRLRQFRQIVQHRAQVEKIQSEPKFKIKKENRLTRADFDLLEDLVQVLEPFENLTLEFSTKGGGRIEAVIPMIDSLVHHLERFLNSANTVPALHNAIITVLNKLFLYYGKTGDCPYYSAAILLHPAAGTRYLKHQRWPQQWIDEAIDATQALYNQRHLSSARAARSRARERRESSSTSLSQRDTFELLDDDDDDDINLDLDNIVQDFATAKRARTDGNGQRWNALEYWKRQYAAGEMHEGLTELALDIFGCPATIFYLDGTLTRPKYTLNDVPTILNIVIQCSPFDKWVTITHTLKFLLINYRHLSKE
ncbi:hypothetical protein JCM1840_002893 [Sporobolomyces johnsonii]